MKKIIHIIVWLAIATGVAFLLSFAVSDHKNQTCTSVNISFTDHATPGFIDENDVEKLIISHFDTLEGCLLDSVNTSAIKGLLSQNPYIRKVAVFESVSGNIHIEIEREIALIRIINKDNNSFYLAESGAVLPTKKGYVPHVMVASGFIKESYKAIRDEVFVYNDEISASQSRMASVHYLALAMKNHPYLNNYIEQIYLNDKGDIELVPADGDHIILLGDILELEKKFRNLMAFYRAGKPAINEGYQTVNLKYTNQIVCKK